MIYSNIYLILCVCAGFAFLYTLIGSRHRRKEAFHDFMLFGMGALFIGRLFYLVLDRCGGDSDYFSLGALGTLSGYLFFAYAVVAAQSGRQTAEHVSETPGRVSQKAEHVSETPEHKHICVLACIVPALLLVGWLLMLLHHLSLSEMVDASLYLLAYIPCSYICMKAVVEARDETHPLYSYKPVLMIIVIWIVISMYTEVAWIIESEEMLHHVAVVFTILGALGYIALPILLEKGKRS